MRFILILSLVLVFYGCKTKKVQPKIATEKRDPRIKKLIGTWYSINETSADRPSKFGKIPRDSSLTMRFKRNGTVITEYMVENRTFAHKWILKSDKLYTQLKIQQQLYSVSRVKSLSDSLLEINFLGYKDIFMPFLCDYENLEYPLGEFVFGSPYIYARYGDSKDAFQDYINENIKFPGEIKEGTECSVAIKINCNGEIVEVKIVGKPILCNKTDFEKSICELIEKMPNWNPAVQNLLPNSVTINALNKYYFTFKDGKVLVKGF